MESINLLLLLDLSAFVFGLICSFSFLFFLKSKMNSFQLKDVYLWLKPLITFLLLIGTVYEFIASIYVMQCSYEIELVFEEPKNFFVLGLFIGSFLVKKPKRWAWRGRFFSLFSCFLKRKKYKFSLFLF